MDKYEKTKQDYENGLEWHQEKFMSYSWGESIDKFSELLNGNKILDIGCGVGKETNAFSKKGMDAIGVDFSSKMIERAKKLFPESKFDVGNMLNLEFEENSFDGIWACASLLNIEEKDAPAALKQFHRVLKPNGLLFISVKEGEGEKFVPDRAGERWFKFYQKEELEKLLEKNGFKVVESHVIKNKNLSESKNLTTSNSWICIFATKLSL